MTVDPAPQPLVVRTAAELNRALTALPISARTPDLTRRPQVGSDPARSDRSDLTRRAQVGFVPTMGASHDGHRALIARARQERVVVVVSVFVNPLQFGPGEDFTRYPRTFAADLDICAAEGVDLVFAPSQGDLWPDPPAVRVTAGPFGEVLEGLHRPGHLDGVATVVAKLLHLVGPCHAYFGRKDAQQLALIRRMVRDLAFDAEVVACETVREPDGLARSSRNVHLAPAARAAAPVLYRALVAARDAWRAGEHDPDVLEQVAASVLATVPTVTPEYVALVTPETFRRPARAGSGQLLAGAVRVGGVRLIDNLDLDRTAD